MSNLTRARAAALDAADPLASFRDRFVIDPTTRYLDGNSLGRLPRAAIAAARRAIEDEWARGLVESWEHWIDLPQRVGALIAPLIGADRREITLADSTTVNLFKLAVAAVRARPGRPTLVTDRGNFPTDRYVVDGIAADLGMEVRLVDRRPDGVLDPAAVAGCLDAGVALVTFSYVDYRSGAIADAGAIDRAAHGVGALTLWDLSHAVGSVPIDLGAEAVDLAVGCTYKYLNGGPGAPAFLYVREELLAGLEPPIRGWFAHAAQFAFDAEFRPAPGIERYLVGTPPILSVAAAAPGIAMAAEAGIGAIRDKSLLLTDLILEHYDADLEALGVGLASPRDHARRGSHIALTHPEGLAISRALRNRRVVVDFRAPTTIRLAVAPLYTTFVEVWDAMSELREVVAGEAWRAAGPGGPVT